ncbi:MAG: hypothetical protein IIX77_01265, partial [Oscillospiraceae bacterium]|nr:hypothetical protein [Oscillospiraceae bacterium]
LVFFLGNYILIKEKYMLAKVFIKDYENIHNRCVRNKYGVIAGIFGVISNLLIGILKLIVGIL